MKFIADLHIHSRYSMATSKKLVPEHLEYWAKLKGINLVGTGDCIHPGWSGELNEKLTPIGNGFFRLKDEYRLPESARLISSGETAFILTGEVSSIYKKNGRVRKVHNILFFPDFDSLSEVQRRLDREGNIRSDGRPILGLDPKIILEMMLEASERAFMVPAHIWTPWFSLFGSKSGFDSIEECFEDLSSHIFAVETGLSSDPPMNRLCSVLDNVRLISNSDAHSPERLGREANLFDCDFSYDGVLNALKNDDGFAGTIEFFPEEGKYHLDGHRACGVRLHPKESLEMKGICPVCGKPLTLGVLYRVYELADRDAPPEMPHHPHRYATRLADIIAETRRVKSSGSQAVLREYMRCVESIGPEFHILLEADIGDIGAAGGALLAEAVSRLREGRLIVESGYDGEFGRIRFFGEDEIAGHSGTQLFETAFTGESVQDKRPGLYEGVSANPVFENRQFNDKRINSETEQDSLKQRKIESVSQKEAVAYNSGSSMVIAGPGSGKTRVLIDKTASLIINHKVEPQEIIALTFSNRAAAEISERLEDIKGGAGVRVHTFHSLGLSIIRSTPELFEMDGEPLIFEEDDIPRNILSAKSARAASAILKKITGYKEGISGYEKPPREFESYGEYLRNNNALDLPDLVFRPAALFRKDAAFLERFRSGVKWLLVDEAQDINPVQLELVKLIISGGGVNLFIIGDPDQSIYGFRGAVNPFESLADTLPEIKSFALDRSFRCPDEILALGASVLGSPRGIKGTGSGTVITFMETASDRSEADWIASRIEALLGGVRSYSFYSGMSDSISGSAAVSPEETAVLCRASFMFGPIADAFRNHGIPFRIIDNRSFLSREPYRECVSLLKKAWRAAAEEPDEKDEIVKMIIKGEPVSNLFRILLIDAGASHEDIEAAESFTHAFGNDFPGFLSSAAMRSGADDAAIYSRSVSLMTIHSAKGLEFRHVFIPGCEDGILPFTVFSGKDTYLSEEARLFYVGITRAIEGLYLSSAKRRAYRSRVLKQPLSRFIERAGKGIITFGQRKERRKNTDDQMTLFE